MNFTILTPEEFTEFASDSPYKTFMQTEQIAKLREANGWTVYYLGVKENEQIKAATMLVAKPTFLGKSTYIAPGGPLLDFENTELTNFFFKNLKNYIKSHNGYILQISPYYELKQLDRDGNPVPNGFNHQNAINNLKSLGFTPMKNPSQPKYMFAMDLEGRTPDQIMADFKRNTRNHVRKAEKSGVRIRELNRDELYLLKEITESTSKRRGFEDRPLSYYEQMYDLFHDSGEVKYFLAEVDKMTANNEEDDSVVSEEAGGGRIVTAKGTSGARQREAERHSPVATGRVDAAPSVTIGQDPLPLSAAMFMLYGDEVVYLFSGSDEKYMKEYNAQYLIQWHIIKYASEHNFKRYNFYGISGLPKNGELDGIYEFKKGFDTKYGHVLEYIGSYELPINLPFYKLHAFFSKLRSK